MIADLTTAGRRSAARRRRAAVGATIGYLTLAGTGALLVGPLVWMILTSLKAPGDEFSFSWLPDPFFFQNYARIWEQRYGTYLSNTVLVSGLATLGSVLSASLVAYGFARLRFFGRQALFMVVLSTMMLPAVVTLIPTFILFQRIGWFNTFLPLVVPSWFAAGPYGGGAFYIFLMRQFYLTLPFELDEAARIDGAGSFQIYWRIMLPLARPGLATVAVFAFIANWSDFLYPLVFLQGQELWTISLALRSWMVPTEHGNKWGLMMAGSVVMVIPVAAVFFAAQRSFVKGIAMSGLAGR